MKSGLRPILNIAGLALCLAFGGVAAAQAQNREKYVISAKAGGINLVSGDVTLRREGTKEEKRLTAQDDLESGDIVSTGVGGRVEVLLNPGSYMRLNENSEFKLTDASLDSLLVNLHKGNAIIEVASADGVKVAINIVTPQSNVLITRGGIYRFNALPNETTEIFIRKGRLLVGKGVGNQVKGGQKVVMHSGRIEVAKFDKKEEDMLDLWSKDRAKTLARANAQLQARSLLAAFRTWDSVNMYSASYSGLGAWIYNPRFNSYCFFPLGGRGWSSPYGHSYTNGGGGWWGAVVNPGNGYQTPGGASGVPNGGNGGGSNPSSPTTPTSPTPIPSSPTPMPSAPPSMPSSPPTIAQPPSREMPSEPGPRREYTREP